MKDHGLGMNDFEIKEICWNDWCWLFLSLSQYETENSNIVLKMVEEKRLLNINSTLDHTLLWSEAQHIYISLWLYLHDFMTI